jgi:hypothetical protein
VKISDCRFNAGEFVDDVDVFVAARGRKIASMCTHVMDLDSTVYAKFRLSCPWGWSRRSVSVFSLLAVVTRGTHQSLVGGHWYPVRTAASDMLILAIKN